MSEKIIDLNEIAVFGRVAELGSFSKASHVLGMPVSTVSRKVASLESRLGTTLMKRTTRKLSLTAAGRRYFEACAHHLEGIRASEDELKALEGRLRVTAPVGFAR